MPSTNTVAVQGRKETIRIRNPRTGQIEELMTTSMICAWLHDVTAARLRDWKRHQLLDVVRDLRGNPVRLNGRHGPENVYRERDVARVEANTATSPTGQKRPPLIPSPRAA